VGHKPEGWSLTLFSDDDIDTIEYRGRKAETGYWMGDEKSEMLLAMRMASQLRELRYTILLETCDPYTRRVVPLSKGDSHWIVLTGLSNEWNWTNLSDSHNWIRINNPFRNRIEYYYWKDIYASASSHRSMVEMYPSVENREGASP
jgi:hypothetical protein